MNLIILSFFSKIALVKFLKKSATYLPSYTPETEPRLWQILSSNRGHHIAQGSLYKEVSK